ncbi:hypothetical protein OEZ85_009845 [Tetradesmus obliquus]|uniref:Mitochondrial carrier protein n=1 Tax=Tetradesmus obliquus TaxID=3088 RepID=A0ABY8UCK8_TETOB|nr:hypothetical protein OEZ85_009845 [Tetradesmus obliquus]
MKQQQHDSSRSSSSDAADAATDLQKRLRSLPTFARELIAGGLAGGLAKTAVAPLERTKIIFQTRGGQLTVQGVLQYIWQHEGFAGLFKGNTASVLRIVPYAAIHFGLYEYYRRAIVQLALPHSKPGSKEQGIPLWDLLAGSASGASAVLATYPLDLVRTRLAYATETPPPATQQSGPGRLRHRHPGIFSLLATTAKDEGLLGLYRGVLPTLLGILPYAGLKFYVYQALKNHYRATSRAGCSDSNIPAGCHTTAAAGGTPQQLLVNFTALAAWLSADSMYDVYLS